MMEIDVRSDRVQMHLLAPNTFRISHRRMTVLVETKGNTENLSSRTITTGAPIIRKFIGQPLGNLVRWLKQLN